MSKKYLWIALVVAILAYPVTVSAAERHWLQRKDYYVDRKEDGNTVCYIAVNTYRNGNNSPVISCVRND